jgi:murein DD-endopeptidase MepM/ murein hydrolase activator NlpD
MVFILGATPALAQDVSVVVSPAQVLQGNTLLVQVPNTTALGDVVLITFNGAPLKDFMYNGKVSAFAAIPLGQKPGEYPIKVLLKNQQTLEKTLTIGARTKKQEVMSLPGGTTPATTKRFVSSLSAENKTIAHIKTANHSLWSGPFMLPLTTDAITDPYGYGRQTGAYLIPHMGTDFRAPVGVPVMAMNSGIVRIARTYKTYGKTVVLDHGLGLSTLYLHLSKINVHVGDVVAQKQVIGLSGATGIVAGPHLHVSVHFGSVAVDPMQFLELFK